MKRHADMWRSTWPPTSAISPRARRPTFGPRSRILAAATRSPVRGDDVVLPSRRGGGTSARAVRIPRPGQLILVAGQARGGSSSTLFTSRLCLPARASTHDRSRWSRRPEGSTAAESAPTRSSAPLPTTWRLRSCPEDAGMDFFSDGLLQMAGHLPAAHRGARCEAHTLVRWFDTNTFSRTELSVASRCRRMPDGLAPDASVPRPRVTSLPSPYMFSRAATPTRTATS